MKNILVTQVVTIPDNITLDVKARKIRVKGPRGTLVRDFKHVNCEMTRLSKDKLRVDVWFGKRAQSATVRTTCSHIENMMKGVIYGFRYKMRYVYAHFPINCGISDDAKKIEIRNFLGEKIVRKVDMLDGVTVRGNTGVKDEIILEGNDIELVSRSAALIQQSTTVKNKDIRKFLDGIYVSEKTTVVPMDA
eukprot:Nk52_evm19s2630 gene=Nk52_evmTU19s2630